MKKFSKILTTAILICLASSSCYAIDLKVRITGIKDKSGSVFVATNVGNPEMMRAEKVSVTGESAQVTLKDVAEGDSVIYVYVDTNNNFELDLDSDGKPIEGCSVHKVKISGQTDVVEIPLIYYSR